MRDTPTHTTTAAPVCHHVTRAADTTLPPVRSARGCACVRSHVRWCISAGRDEIGGGQGSHPTTKPASEQASKEGTLVAGRAQRACPLPLRKRRRASVGVGVPLANPSWGCDWGPTRMPRSFLVRRFGTYARWSAAVRALVVADARGSVQRPPRLVPCPRETGE